MDSAQNDLEYGFDLDICYAKPSILDSLYWQDILKIHEFKRRDVDTFAFMYGTKTVGARPLHCFRPGRFFEPPRADQHAGWCGAWGESPLLQSRSIPVSLSDLLAAQLVIACTAMERGLRPRNAPLCEQDM